MQDGLFGLNARHRVEQFDVDLRGMLNAFEVVDRTCVGRAIDEFVALIAKAHCERFDFVSVPDSQRDDERDVLISLPHRAVVPEMTRTRHRYRNEAESVE